MEVESNNINVESSNKDQKIDELVIISPKEDGSIFFKCKICEISYPSRSYLKKHVKTHIKDNPYACEYENCNKAFARKGTLTEHRKRVHEKIHSHTCPICGKGFYDKRDKQKHIIIHDEARKNRERFLPPNMLKLLNEVDNFNFDGREIFSSSVCDICGKIFEKPSEVKRHRDSVHNENKIALFTCKITGCTTTFSDQSSLYVHMMNHDNGKRIKIEQQFKEEKKSSSFTKNKSSSQVFKWGNIVATPNEVKIKSEDCLKPVYENKAQVQMKEQNEADDDKLKNPMFSCDLCDNFLSTQESLDVHKLIHNETTNYICEIEKCKLEFNTKKRLDTHKNIDHGVDTTPAARMFHKCPDCGKTFPKKDHMKYHQRRHSEEKPFICADCGKGFKIKKSLDYHMKWHAGIADLQCDICDAQYVSPTALMLHKKHKHPGPLSSALHSCHICGKEYIYKGQLSIHMTKHTGEKRFNCRECGKNFRLDGAYKNHLRIHTGIKEYRCSFCGKEFTQKQQLVVHERRHTGDKRHKCTICEKAFVEPATLRHHLKTHKISK